jgi:hypothetical protein
MMTAIVSKIQLPWFSLPQRTRNEGADRHRQRQPQRKAQHRRIGREMDGEKLEVERRARPERGQIDIADRRARDLIVRQRPFQPPDMAERVADPLRRRPDGR